MQINIKPGDKNSVRNAIAQLRKANASSDTDDQEVDKIVYECYEKCIENLNSKKYEEYTTQFKAVKEAITTTPAQNGVGYINIGSPAVYVEMGTGVAGATRPHPTKQGGTSIDSDVDWNYGAREGWVYPTNESASNPKKWQGSDGNWYGYTKGMESRPFAFEAAQYIKDKYKDVKVEFVSGGGSKQ